jgi:hypothetical protein
MAPTNAFAAKMASGLQKVLMECSDKRISVSSEIFSGIRTLKYFAWELKVIEWMKAVREIELKQLKHYLSFVAGLSIFWYLFPLLVTMSSFMTYVFVMKQPLSATVVR